MPRGRVSGEKPGKREILAHWLHATGIYSVFNRLPQRKSLLVINYHRVGDPNATPYDAGVFSATAEQFRAQMEFVADRLKPITLDEAFSFLGGNDRQPQSRCRVLITFDDGYVDNFRIAFPILRDLGIQGVFFLPTAFIGTHKVPWWDRVSYLIVCAQKQRFEISRPVEASFDIGAHGAREVARRVINLFRESPPDDLERAIEELEQACGGSRPDGGADRCFLDWEEVLQMVDGGMAIGAHTHTHRVLGLLSEPEQRKELTESRRWLRDRIGVEVESLAYPLGSTSSFTAQTRRLAAEAGYRAAFSFYGGINRFGGTEPFDVRRVGADGQSAERFETQAVLAAVTNHFWP